MTSGSFKEPNFFGQNVHYSEPEATGTVVEPRFFDEFTNPVALAAIKDRVPDFESEHYVAKMYDFKDEEIDQLLFTKSDVRFFEDEQPYTLSTHDCRALTLVDKSQILHRRQKELGRYLSAEGENFVVPSNFFILKNKQDFNLYEVQKKLPAFVTLGQLRERQDYWQFQNVFSDQAQLKFKSQAEILAIKLAALASNNEDPYFKYFVPDLAPGNIAVELATGAILLFDTNVNYERQTEPLASVKILLSCNMLRRSAQMLK